MIKADLQQQLNEVRESIGESLQAMKGQIAKVQKSQGKMWDAISRMGEKHQGLAAKENDSYSEHEEEETALEYSLVETPVPHKMASHIPLFGMPPPSAHFDATSVRDSVSSTVPR